MASHEGLRMVEKLNDFQHYQKPLWLRVAGHYEPTVRDALQALEADIHLIKAQLTTIRSRLPDE